MESKGITVTLDWKDWELILFTLEWRQMKLQGENKSSVLTDTLLIKLREELKGTVAK